MNQNPKMSASEDVWVQLFVLLFIVSGVFSAHYIWYKYRTFSPLPGLSAAFVSLRETAARLAAQRTVPAAVPAAVSKVAGRRIVAAPKGTDLDCMSLPEALAGAGDGDVIVLHPGIYKESLQISKSVTIRGGGVSPDQVILTPANSNTLAVSGGQVVLENMTLSNTAPADYWVLTVSKASLALRNVKIRSSGDGLRVHDADLNVSDSEFNAGTALAVSGKSRVKLVRAVLTGEDAAVTAEGGEVDLRLESSRIQDSRGTGLTASRFALVRMNDMTISGNVFAAVSVYSGAEVRITKSKITDNSECGVLVEGGGRIILEQVRILRNKCGVGFNGPGTLDARNSRFSELTMGAVAVKPGLGSSAVIRGSGNTGPGAPGGQKKSKN